MTNRDEKGVDDKLRMELAEARAKLDELVAKAMGRPLTDAQQVKAHALESYVEELAAKIGENRVRRSPYPQRAPNPPGTRRGGWRQPG